MKNKTIRFIFALGLVFLIIFLSYGENQKIQDEFNVEEDQLDGGLYSLFSTTEKESIEEPEVDIPQYVQEALCGSYFQETGMCAGTCPEGKCVSKGKSCYCRLE